MKLAKFKLLCGLVKCHLLLVAEDIFNRRICAVEVDQENSIVEHMEKEHKLQKVQWCLGREFKQFPISMK